MVEFLLGVAVGAGGAVMLNKNGDKNNNAKQSEIDSLYRENEKFRNRNKELERKMEDLVAAYEKQAWQIKDIDRSNEDYEDEVDDLKAEVKKLRRENIDLAAQLKEYKAACESYERQLKSNINK